MIISECLICMFIPNKVRIKIHSQQSYRVLLNKSVTVFKKKMILSVFLVFIGRPLSQNHSLDCSKHKFIFFINLQQLGTLHNMCLLISKKHSITANIRWQVINENSKKWVQVWNSDNCLHTLKLRVLFTNSWIGSLL